MPAFTPGRGNFPLDLPGNVNPTIVPSSERWKYDRLAYFRGKKLFFKKRADDAWFALNKAKGDLVQYKRLLKEVKKELTSEWVPHTTIMAKVKKVTSQDVLDEDEINFVNNAKACAVNDALIIQILFMQLLRRAKIVQNTKIVVRNAEVVYTDLREHSLSADRDEEEWQQELLRDLGLQRVV